MTGIPSKNITDDDTTKLVELEKNIKKQVVGQNEAVEKIAMAILRNKAGLGDMKRPIGTFMFLGPTGVGKTYIAKKLAEQLFTTERDMIRIDMSEYMEKHSVSRLIGSPPGYVGYDDGGQLTEKVRRKPYSVVLLDEIEKAHPDVANVLLQIFDDGILTDSQGRTVDFKNTVIIMTSNIGSREAKLRGNGIGFSREDGALSKTIIDKELKKKFAPEFLNRIDEIVSFNSLGKPEIKNIIDIEIAKFIAGVKESRNVEIELDDTTKDFLFEKGWDADNGARPLKRAIQKFIENEISVKLLMKEVVNGDRIKIIKSLTEDKLEFLKPTNLLDLGSIEGTISENK
jgi:ATP-dependent Clp protease ATP-binding subunit ClpC